MHMNLKAFLVTFIALALHSSALASPTKRNAKPEEKKIPLLPADNKDAPSLELELSIVGGKHPSPLAPSSF